MNNEFWDKKYKKSDFTYGEEPNAFLASQAEHLDGLSHAFVPGDGEGRNGIWLAKQGLSVTTVDLSSVGVSVARKRAVAAGVEMDIRTADLENYDWKPESFDCIAAIWLHLPPPVRRKVHAGLWEALRPGGLLFIEAYRPAHVEFRDEYESKGGPGTPIVMFTQKTFQRDFSGAEFELLEDADVELDEGTGHQGRSATVRARIRKPK